MAEFYKELYRTCQEYGHCIKNSKEGCCKSGLRGFTRNHNSRSKPPKCLHEYDILNITIVILLHKKGENDNFENRHISLLFTLHDVCSAAKLLTRSYDENRTGYERLCSIFLVCFSGGIEG